MMSRRRSGGLWFVIVPCMFNVIGKHVRRHDGEAGDGAWRSTTATILLFNISKISYFVRVYEVLACGITGVAKERGRKTTV
jgi:hypothetical protein